MDAAVVLAMLVPLSAYAQQAVSHRLLAQTFSLTDANLQARIWSEQLPQMISFRKYLQQNTPNGASLKLVGEAFSTTFDIGGKHIVISIVNNNCANADGIPNARLCPAKVVAVSGDKLRVIAQTDQFLTSAYRGEAGYDATTNVNARFMTVATYDPKAQQITFTDVNEGERSPIAWTIPLN